MSSVQITAEKRDTAKKPKYIREESRIPAVVYGHNFESTPIELDYQEFRKSYKKTGDSTIMTLVIDGTEVDTLVHGVQYEPVSDEYMHVDFLAVQSDEPVKAFIPVHTTGLAPAVKNLQGSLITPVSEVEVQCLPKFLIKDITVDVSKLETFNDSIHISDLEIATNTGITILTDVDSVVATVTPPKGGGSDEEDEEADAPEADAKPE